jgi:hypothetical protein
VPSEAGTAIEWNESEKFYDADKWMAYLVDTFLKPGAAVARELTDPVPGWIYPEEFGRFTFDHVVNGAIEAEGEEPADIWRLEVRDNTVYAIHGTLEPAYDEIAPHRACRLGRRRMVKVCCQDPAQRRLPGERR